VNMLWSLLKIFVVILTFQLTFFISFSVQADEKLGQTASKYEIKTDRLNRAAGTADLFMTKGVNNPTPVFGAAIGFTLTVVNDGPDTATGVKVSELLHAGLTYQSDSSGDTYNKTTGVWNVGQIDAGLSSSITINVTVDLMCSRKLARLSQPLILLFPALSLILLPLTIQFLWIQLCFSELLAMSIRA